MKSFIFALALVFTASLPAMAVETKTCEEKSWMVQVDAETISKEDLITALDAMGKAENTEVVFHGLWYVLNDQSTGSAVVSERSLSSILTQISQLDGVKVFCNRVIHF